MKPEDYPMLLSRSMAERLTGIDVRELDKLRKSGQIRCYTTLGGQYRFHKSSLLQYIEKQSNENGRLQLPPGQTSILL